MTYKIYKKHLFLVFFAAMSFSMAQSICEIATPVCSNENFSGNPPSGNPGGTIDGGCQNLEADDVTWYFIRIQSGSTFTFTIVPDSNDDYDFAVWKNPNCENLGEADRASYDAPGPYTTGLSMTATQTCEGAAGTGYVKYLDVVPGDEILIAVDKFSDFADGFTLVFGNGDAGEGDAQLDCTITGEPYGVCDLDFNNEEYFDLDIIGDDITDGEPTWTVDFYEVESDALAGNSNTVSSPYLAYEINNPTTLFARVEDNGVFENIVQVFLYVNPKPQLLVFEIELSLCDSDEDGEAIFDLTQTEPDFVTNSGDYIFRYYTDINDAHDGNSNNINPANAYSSGNDDIYVRIDLPSSIEGEEGCYSLGTIHLKLEDQIIPEFEIEDSYCINMTLPPLPNVSDNGITGTWSPSSTIDTGTIGPSDYTFIPDDGQCAVETTISVTITELLSAQFDIADEYCQGSEPDPLPSTSDNGIEGTWDQSMIDTYNVGTSTYTFTPDVECFEVYTLTVTITNGVALNPVNDISLCDDDFDGTYETDLTTLNNQLLYPNTGYTFFYYENYSDVTNGNPIPSSQWNDYPLDNMSVWVVVESADGCRSAALEINFVEGDEISLLSPPYEIPFCDSQPIDLTDFGNIYTTETGVNITYHTTLINAQNGVSPITNTTNYTPASVGSVLYVRLEKNGRCSEVVEVEFTAGDEATHNDGPFDPVQYCLSETRDLTEYEPDMSPTPSSINFSYFENMLDAQSNTNPINDPVNYTFPNASGSVFIRLEQQGKCPVILELPYTQRPAPSLTVPSEETLCDEEEVEITATSDDPDATFEWTSPDGVVLTGATQTFTDYGTYVVVAIGIDGCESEARTVTIAPPAPPTITSIESGDGSITVYAANGGSGPMEYSLDGVLWQNSNQFSNLVNGETYTIYVRSDTCVVTSYKITILSVPNFVSPNGDGYNDEWTIRGIEVTPDATIKIFDRYGKVFVDTNFDGNYVWDGKYGGNPLPSGDYWYILNVPGNGVIVPQKYVGHISIRNQ